MRVDGGAGAAAIVRRPPRRHLLDLNLKTITLGTVGVTGTMHCCLFRGDVGRESVRNVARITATVFANGCSRSKRSFASRDF